MSDIPYSEIKNSNESDVQEDIFEAILYQDTERVTRILNANPEAINARYGASALTPLHYAANFKSIDVLNAIIDKTADINERDANEWTAIHYAIDADEYDNVPHLIEKGAYVDAQDKNGFTPLMLAIYQFSPKTAKLLLDKNADITLRSKEGTALDIATELSDNYAECAEIANLIENQATLTSSKIDTNNVELNKTITPQPKGHKRNEG